jgi:flagellar biosynthesis protein FlhF
MMNVKKYRGETTREALEKIKQDIGDDAFVLETKQVRAGGFMGLGAKTQIEISAVASADSASSNGGSQKSKIFQPNRFLNLTDDALALPSLSSNGENVEKPEIMKALKSRAEPEHDFTESFGYKPTKVKSGVSLLRIDAVELSPEAPKVIHQPVEKSARSNNFQTLAPEIQVEDPKVKVSSRELDLLRAELREVKFSISSFAARQNFSNLNAGTDSEKSSITRKPPFSDAFVELMAMGLSTGIANALISKIVSKFKKGTILPADIAKASLEEGILDLVKFGEDPLSGDKPTIMAIIGSTGVGKTTTVAKLAARIALEERKPVELVTLDTYRIAAVEQLVTYAEIIGAGCHVVRSVLELEGLLRKFPDDATVLIDTTGKNPHDLADQHEFSLFLKRHKEIRKCLAIQATTHPVDAIAAIKKFEMYGADCLALTKLDETTRPGAMLELAAESGLPLTYLCMGQRVPEDLKAATPENFAARIFGETA